MPAHKKDTYIMTNIKLTALLIILSLLASCSEETIINYIDPPVPERTQGVIKVKAEDYTPEVSIRLYLVDY